MEPIREEYSMLQSKVLFILDALQALHYQYETREIPLHPKAASGLEAHCLEITHALEAFEERLNKSPL